MYQPLKRLCHRRGEQAVPADGAKVATGDPVLPQWFGQHGGGGDGVLNRRR